MKKQIIAALAVGVMAVTALPVGASADYTVPKASPIYCVTAAKPAKPTLVKGYVSTRNSVTIRWNKVKKATGYRVYFYNAAIKKWQAVKTTKTLSYKKTGLKAGTKYKFKVRAFKKSGKKTVWGKYSAVKNVVTTPAAVTLKVGGISTNTATLSWNKVSCDSVQIQQNNNGKWTSVATVSKSTTSYTLTGLEASTRYTYRVRAYIKDADKTATRYSSCEKVFTTYPDAPETTPTSTTTTTTAPASKPTSTTTTTTTSATTTTTAHVHNWVDVTETRTIHHDAEYATRTYWDKPCWYNGVPNEDYFRTTVWNTPGRYGDWMNVDAGASNVFSVPTFDILLWKYGTPSNFPSYVQQFHSVEDCDNFFGFSGSVLFCNTNPVTGSHVPDFNPKTDIILTYDNYDLDNDAWNDLYGKAVSWDFWMYNNSMDEVYPVFQEQIKVRDAWDETTTVVVGHKCTSCGATKE